MKTENGRISQPIQQMMAGNKFGSVTFKVRDFRQKFNTRTAALGNKSRHGFDIYTKSDSDDEVRVIRRGCEDMPSMVVDLR